MSEPPSAVEATVLAPSIATLGESPAATDTEPLGAGVLLSNRWELLALLGVGGMGSVYRARDRELDELVAVKVLRREIARAPGMLERFRREVKLARRVTHPNVARTFDIGEAGDLRFLTMELLDGAPLSRNGARWPLDRLIPVASAICKGLGAAHAAGVVHRDLKPDNVIVERSKRVVITDFGIARALGNEGASNETLGAVVGTPLYMAPEQVAHDAEIGPPCDFYALGCMLFELASGAPPWSGPTPLAVAAARLLAPPPELQRAQPDLPEAFSRLVLSMMARNPAGRPASAEEIAEALAVITPAPIHSLRAPFSQVPGGFTPRPTQSSMTTPTQGASSGQPSGHWGAPKSIAVLQIANLGAADDDYLAAALSDDLADILSGSPGLRVRPRTLAARAAEGQRDPRDVGRDLDVQVVVSGDLRRQGDTLHATVRLITVEDGFQLWAQRFSADARDFMRVGDEAAAAIAAALLARPMAKREAPADPEALDLYMRGRYLLARTWGATPEALAVLTKAVELAPEDRRIRLAYASATIRGVSLRELPPASAVRALEIIEGVLREDPRDAEALWARAQLHFTRGEAVSGANDLRNVFEISPSLQPALATLGDILIDMNQLGAASVVLARARALDPSHFPPRASLTRLAGFQGDFARGVDALGPVPPDPFDVGVYWVVRARFAMWAGNRAEARLVRDEVVKPGGHGFLSDVCDACTAATLGLPLDDAAVARARGGLDPRGPGQRVAAFQLQFTAEVLCVVGDIEAALAAAAAADASGTFDAAWVERCPAIDPLRALPAFAEIRQRVLGRAERVLAALGELKLDR